MNNIFWPIITGKSFFDIWSFVHFSFWIFIGSVFWPFVNKYTLFSKERLRVVVLCTIVAYIWEFFERFAEHKWPHLWLNRESFCNSYVSDPLTAVVGVYLIMYLLDRFAK